MRKNDGFTFTLAMLCAITLNVVLLIQHWNGAIARLNNLIEKISP